MTQEKRENIEVSKHKSRKDLIAHKQESFIQSKDYFSIMSGFLYVRPSRSKDLSTLSYIHLGKVNKELDLVANIEACKHKDLANEYILRSLDALAEKDYDTYRLLHDELSFTIKKSDIFDYNTTHHEYKFKCSNCNQHARQMFKDHIDKKPPKCLYGRSCLIQRR